MRNSELFLQKYRILEGLLERRYEGEKLSSSVVIEYIRDDDSQPVRTDLDLMRSIRNILSHNAGDDGAPVVEPSAEMIVRLDEIIEYVKHPRLACEFGTPADRILSARPNDLLLPVMRSMCKNGFSHVPVRDDGRVTGVLSIKSIFDHLAENGFESLEPKARVSCLGERLRIDRKVGERYMFVPQDTSIVTVRAAFRQYTHRNSRLSIVFVTPNGSPDEQLICMLTPWDVLSDHKSVKETNHAPG